MSRGLKAALMTVAVVMIGLKAMAIAPTVLDVPDVVVGNEGGATASNVFIYPDAIDLDAHVTDLDTPNKADIKWSFTAEPGKDFYQLNGINANTDLSTATLLNPGAKDISKNLGAGESNPDTKLSTVTIRNKNLSPLTGTGAIPGANVKNVIPAETAMLTLFASDGTGYGVGTPFFVYTDNGGSDRPFITAPAWTSVVPAVDFTGTTGGFTYKPSLGAASGTNGGTAICLNCNPDGNNFAWWETPNGLFTPVKNAVYRIRATMNSDQTATSATNQNALWDILLDNSSETTDAVQGSNLFYFDSLIFDNFGGGGNTIISSAPKTFDFYWAPASINSTRWNDPATGAFLTANATKIQTRLTFRVLDLPGNGGIHAATAKGNLCLDKVQVDRIDIGSMTAVGSVALNITALNATAVTCTSISNLATYAGGILTMAPGTAGQSVEYAQVYPGNLITPADQASVDTTNLLDNYPVAWTDNSVFKVTYTVAAVDATKAPGFLCFGMDSMDSGLTSLNYITNQLGSIMMPTATAQDYVTFCSAGLASPLAKYAHLRPRLEFGNNTVLSGPGGIKISAIKVQAVKVN